MSCASLPTYNRHDLMDSSDICEDVHHTMGNVQKKKKQRQENPRVDASFHFREDYYDCDKEVHYFPRTKYKHTKFKWNRSVRLYFNPTRLLGFSWDITCQADVI